MKIGNAEIWSVEDGVARMPPTEVFASTTEGDWEPHRRFLADDGLLELALGGFLVTGASDRVVLIDAGVGTISSGPFRGGRLLASLAARGLRPEDVTDVVFTHLHFDHVGWATQKGQVVFTNATYRCDARDWAHFVGPDPGATRKLSPIEGQLEPWEGSGRLLPGIDCLAAPGHTPGSTILVVSSGDERALLLGDVVHCPVELVDEEWNGMGDVDPELAKRTRNALAREYEGSDVPMAASHFPGLQFGRLLRGQGARHWIFE
jgi:glyoxylase-like metal-dependent hydrolase (beta-lactamase superfamily II)